MSVPQARRWLIMASLILTGSVLLFFLLAPALGYPLVFAQGVRIIEIILPVFLAYLGSAAQFVFRAGAGRSEVFLRAAVADLAGLLVRGPVIIFALALVATIVAFGITNGPRAAPGSGITVDQLAAAVSAALGLLAVTTNVAMGYLFPGETQHEAP